MQHFACMSETETGCICVLEKPFNAGNIQLTIVCAFLYTERAAYVGLRYASMNASVGLRHARMNASGGLRHADSFSRTCFCVVKSRQIISSRSCLPYTVGSATITRQASYMLPGGWKFRRNKIQKVMLKICFGQGKYGMLRRYGCTISVFTRISVFLWSRNL